MVNVLYHGKFKGLARELQPLGFQLIKHRPNRVVDFRDTCFIYYPPLANVRNAPDSYEKTREFMWKHKAGQRSVLGKFFSTPGKEEGPFVVRPSRHYGGRQFFVADTVADAKRIGREIGDHYYSALFERTHEFRSVFVGGNHIVTFRKKIGERGEDLLPQDVPWNRHHLGDVRYLTVKGTALKKSGFFDASVNFFEEYPLDIVALDTAYNSNTQEYVVFEANLAPLISIEHVVASISEAIKHLRR